MISETLETFAEDCLSVTPYEIARKLGRNGKATLKGSAITLNGTVIKLTITRTPFDGSRLWLLCPECGKRCGKLYTHPLGGQVACRLCLRLDYRSHRYSGMAETYVNLSHQIILDSLLPGFI